MDSEEKKKGEFPTLLIFFLIGVVMILFPGMFDTIDSSGKMFIKILLSYVWGIPCGIIIIVVSGAVYFYQYRKAKQSSENQEDLIK